MHSRVFTPDLPRKNDASSAAVNSVPGSTCEAPPVVADVEGVAGAAPDPDAGVDGTAPVGLCFFGFGVPEVATLPPGTAVAPSSALRFFGALRFVDDPPAAVGDAGAGLVARLASGLAARLPCWLCAGVFSLGAFGEVARLATTEWPPMPPADVGGEPGVAGGARDTGVVSILILTPPERGAGDPPRDPGREGVFEPETLTAGVLGV